MKREKKTLKLSRETLLTQATVGGGGLQVFTIPFTCKCTDPLSDCVCPRQ